MATATGQAAHQRVIAIDGPSGSGKSTVARAVGRVLGFLHVDSGALYRIVTWQALQRGIDCQDEDALAELVNNLDFGMAVRDGAVAFAVGGVDPGEAIRQPEINAHVSPVARAARVRTRVTAWLRGMRRLGDLVVEGRDICTVVFPDTPARFYLDASPAERARRRHLEEQGKGIAQGQEAVLASLLARDQIDRSRATAPLRVAENACVIDSTNMPIEAVVQYLLNRLPPVWFAEASVRP